MGKLLNFNTRNISSSIKCLISVRWLQNKQNKNFYLNISFDYKTSVSDLLSTYPQWYSRVPHLSPSLLHQDSQLWCHLVNEILRLCIWAVLVNFIIGVQTVNFTSASSMRHLPNETNNFSFPLWPQNTIIQWEIRNRNPLYISAYNLLFVPSVTETTWVLFLVNHRSCPGEFSCKKTLFAAC